MYYTIQNGSILTAENIGALAQYYDNVQELPVDYVEDKYVVEKNELVLNPNYEAEQAQKERERLDNLSLTKADVERAIYADKGMDFDDLIEYVKVKAPTIDIKVLKIELGANNFFRKHPYINQLGQLLGYTSDDLNYLFENKVLPVKEAE